MSLNFKILAPSCSALEAWREKQEKVLQGRKVVGSLGHVMRGGTVSLDIMKTVQEFKFIIVVTSIYK